MQRFLQRDRELLFDLVAEFRARVIGAEGIDLAVRCGVVDHATLHPLDVVVVAVHEMHARYEQGAEGEFSVMAVAAVLLVGHALERLQKFRERQAARRLIGAVVTAERVQRLQLAQELDPRLAQLARQLVEVLHHAADIDEAGDRHRLPGMLVHEQVRAQRAVCMAGEGGDLFATNGADQPGKRRDKREREVVAVHFGYSGLVGNAVRKIGQRKALFLQFLAVDTAGEGDRLEADRRYRIDVLERDADDVSDLVVVDPLHDGGHQADLDAGLAAVFDCPQLGFQQRLPADLEIDVVGHAVKLQVDVLQAVLGGFHREIKVRHQNAVGRGLHVREAHIARHGADFEKVRVHRRLAAGKLYDPSGDRLFVAQGLEHLADGGHVGLIEVAGRIGIGETYRAGQVAAVGQINVGQHRVRVVDRAQAAIGGTILRVYDRRVGDSAVVAELPLLHLQIKLDVGRDDVAEIAVLRTRLLHDHLALLFENQCGDDLDALRAQRLRALGQALRQFMNQRAGARDFRLHDFEVRPLGGGEFRGGCGLRAHGRLGRESLCAQSTSSSFR